MSVIERIKLYRTQFISDRGVAAETLVHSRGSYALPLFGVPPPPPECPGGIGMARFSAPHAAQPEGLSRGGGGETFIFAGIMLDAVPCFFSPPPPSLLGYFYFKLVQMRLSGKERMGPASPARMLNQGRGLWPGSDTLRCVCH